MDELAKAIRYAENVWAQGEPYLVPSAIAYLEEIIQPTFSVFEWGAGGSTIWFSKRVTNVVSIEHQRDWLDKLRVRLDAEHINNIDLMYIGVTQPIYADIISRFDFEFDLVLVDGRERVKCIISAIDKVRPGGFLILDNSERPRYEPGIALLSGWERLDFENQWVTSIFRRS